MKANITKHDSQYINLRTGGMLASRRDCVKGLVGLAGILATGQAPAAFVRSMLGARNAAMFGGNLSAKSYIQKGLISLFDGIENAGFCIHNANATYWQDLIGTNDAALTKGHSGESRNPNMYWADNALVYPTNLASANFTADIGNSLSIEICYSEMVKISNYWAFYDTFDDVVNFYFYNKKGVEYVGERLYGSYSDGQTEIIGSEIIESGSISHCFNSMQSFLYYKNKIANFKMGSSEGLSKRWSIGGPYSTNFFTGKIHSFRIYNRVLSIDEIKINEAIDKARFNLP